MTFAHKYTKAEVRKADRYYRGQENPGLWSAYCLGKRAAFQDLANPFTSLDYQRAWDRGKLIAENLASKESTS